MKALSLTNPWGLLVVLQAEPGRGEKQYETRGWRWTPRPQEIYIHAAKNFPKWARELCGERPFKDVLARHGWDVSPEFLPAQCIIGRVRIVRAVRTEDIRESLSPVERAFGDYSDGRIAIELADPVFFKVHVRCAGALGLWNVPMEIEAQINNQL